MAEIKLTAEQSQVVDARNCNLLVAAAAGSGKTAVLVQRIIKKILDKEHPQDIDRLLIVTFTNAAAAEMRERIGAAIEKALLTEPENKHLQRQMLLLHNAQITTIHSFCLSVIREFFHVLKLDPGFTIGDEAELSLLRADVMEEVLEECYEEEDEVFLAFAECFGQTKSDDRITEYGRKLYELSMSQPWPEKWLATLSEGFSIAAEDVDSHPMFLDILRRAKECISDCESLNEKMLSVAESADGPRLYTEALLSDKEQLALLKRAASYGELEKALAALEYERLSGKRQEASEEKKQLIKNLRNTMKKLLGQLEENYFYAPVEELAEELNRMELPMRGLLLLTRRFQERYQEEKAKKNLLDFSDLEHMALQILVDTSKGEAQPSKEAKILSGRFDEIMIDEYQDSNRIQELILNSISGEWEGNPNTFMVGDVKQSIYRFRMACPDLFIDKYQRYKAEGAYRKIDLHKNFRSRKSVLESVNVLFSGLMHEESTEVEYDDAAALYCGAEYPGETGAYDTEIMLVSCEEGTAGGSALVSEEAEDEETATGAETEELTAEEKNRVQAEAEAIAARIRELKQDGFLVGNEKERRTVEYKDIVILLRTMSGWSETFLEVFSELGIPAYADTASGYFKTLEIKKTMDFLRILDNPRQDIPFAAVLHSPIGGFHAEELAQLRIRYGEKNPEKKTAKCLYEATKAAAEAFACGNACDSAEKKAAAFFALYEKLRAEAEYLPVHELIEHIFTYSGFRDAMTVLPGGAKRQGNLDMLVVKARQYEQTSFSGLYDFIRYMDRLVKFEVDFGEAQTGDGGNMVRIMSIHKSKGLEFPVVFIGGMEKTFNRMDMRERIIFHPTLGIGPESVDLKNRVKSPTILKKMIKATMNDEMVAEELRVLYVAMTRAKEKLILTGTLKNPEKRLAAWTEGAEVTGETGMLASYISKANTYFDFVCPLVFAGKKQEQNVYRVERTVNETTFSADFSLELRDGTDGICEKTIRAEEKKEKLAWLQGILEAEEASGTEAKEIRALLMRGVEYEYPYEVEAELPMKVTVSQLKHLAMEENEEIQLFSYEEPEQREDSYPEFLTEAKVVSGSEKGTLYHHVLELLPYDKVTTPQEVTEFLDGLVSDGRMLPSERTLVSDKKIWNFLDSGIGRRIRRASDKGCLFREQPFVLGLPAKEVFKDSEGESLIMVQGVIDAFFEEDGQYVLLDYKTDYIHKDAKRELTDKYERQLYFYRCALEQILSKTVKEVWIYSVFADEEILL